MLCAPRVAIWDLVVLAALRSRHAKSSVEVVEWGLWAISMFAQDSNDNQALLGEQGACAGEAYVLVKYLLRSHAAVYQFLRVIL